jgi:hypothetical protein
MLALDDSALARILGAAKRVSPRKRSAWLRELAEQLEGRGDNITSAARPAPGSRLRRHRARRKAGRRCVRLEIDEIGVESLLEAEGLLPEGVDHEWPDVERALGRFVALLSTPSPLD